MLELMVYNRFHRVLLQAFQQAVRLLGATSDGTWDERLSLAMSALEAVPPEAWLRAVLADPEHQHREAMADALVNPRETAYTVGELSSLCRQANLRLALPASNPLDCAKGTGNWEMALGDGGAQPLLAELDDVDRWHVANLIQAERSPQLWFYCVRLDSCRNWPTMRQVCDEFLARPLRPVQGARRRYVRSDGEGFRLTTRPLPVAAAGPRGLAATVAQKLGTGGRVGDVLGELGGEAERSLRGVNELRIELASREAPHLCAA